MDLLFWMAVFGAMSLYMQTVIVRDKKHRKVQAEYVRLQKTEKGRKIREAKLQRKLTKDPNVIMLCDYRPSHRSKVGPA